MFRRSIYAYTAGLIDGEGYIGIIRNRNKSGTVSYGVTLEVSNTNKEIIDWLVSHHGGISTPVNRKTHHHSRERPQWKWILRRRGGLAHFLFYMSRYCIIKRDHIQLARDFMLGHIGKDVAFQKMKELNQRGKQAIPEVAVIGSSDYKIAQ